MFSPLQLIVCLRILSITFVYGMHINPEPSSSFKAKIKESKEREQPIHLDPPHPINKSSLLLHTTLLVVADVGSSDALQASQCTYMSTLDPEQIIYVSDYRIPNPGGCNLPIIHSLRVPFATDFYDILREVYLSKIPLHPWVLIVKPWTFVHPGRVSAYLNERGLMSSEVYVGNMRNATSELAALGQMPHIAYEYGILIRSWGCLLVGRDRAEYHGYLSLLKNDFHTIESGLADIAATLLVFTQTLYSIKTLYTPYIFTSLSLYHNMANTTWLTMVYNQACESVHTIGYDSYCVMGYYRERWKY